MKNLVKVFSILLISLMVIMFCTNVLAADSTNNGFSDLTSTLTGGNNTNTNTNNTNTRNTNTNNTNTNLYNNSGLPKTGIEASVPVAMLIVIFGISSVYAYKKVKDYKNL